MRCNAFCQRLVLLVVDKVIIGALIAAAFVVYDRWKTMETRHYNERRQEVELAFTRDEHARQFLPLTMNASADSLVRAEYLAALVDTNSISPDSAVRLAQRLIRDGFLEASTIDVTPYHRFNEQYGRTLENTAHRGPEEEILAEIMGHTMPSGLPSVLSTYRRVVQQIATIERGSSQESSNNRLERLRDAQSFWSHVFRESINTLDDSGPALLDSEQFLVRNVLVIDDIAGNIPAAEAEQWFASSSRALRTVGAVALADAEQPNRAAIEHLLPIVNPHIHIADLRFSSVVVDVLRYRAVWLPELLSAALDFVLSARVVVSQPDRAQNQSAVRTLVQEISDYLYWSIGVSEVTEALEGRIRDEVSRFVESIARVPIESLRDRDYLVDRVLVRSLSASGRGGNREAQELRAVVYQLGVDKLRRIGLGDFVQDWEAGR